MRDVTTLSRRDRLIARIESAAEELGMRIAEYDEYLQTPEGRNEERLFQEQTQGRIVEEQNEEHNRATPATASDESMGNPNSDDNEYR
ncbi:hypothetical protein MRS44_010232 [Fusarium solani]|jgi:DNA-binding transcriptional MerR regulator|uniref:uncharacterized protein n=1 Tax=Fusarium solani TaxID=169388 RepID=UPI0032C4B14B|nr:hypothetical protein MRS44_010232 [Fusarium solani]